MKRSVLYYSSAGLLEEFSNIICKIGLVTILRDYYGVCNSTGVNQAIVFAIFSTVQFFILHFVRFVLLCST
jgi:hypothetical protein